jgi:hypothetical protein
MTGTRKFLSSAGSILRRAVAGTMLQAESKGAHIMHAASRQLAHGEVVY